MYILRQTVEFQNWLDGLKDQRAQVRIAARLRLAEAGNLGDWKPVGGEVSEMRIDYGPGYRLYFTRRGALLLIMPAEGETNPCKNATSSAPNAWSRNWRSNHEQSKDGNHTHPLRCGPLS
jgi:putative addiction module killer protein